MVMYNEINKYMAQWLRNLIAAGLIADGVVWECSIEDIKPEDLNEFDQCHFFAGLGGWSLALRAAGIPDDYRVWTASAPCQPFSAAGAGRGTDDERHLWPVVARLIKACRPARVLGEQVASSLITGKPGTEGVQRLWERKALIGVCADWLEKDLSHRMQELSQRRSPGDAADAQRLDSDPRFAVGGGCQSPGGAEGVAVRPDGQVGAGSARLWSLRGYRDTVQPGIETWLGHSVAGPDTAGGRVHDGQHPGNTRVILFGLNAACGNWGENKVIQMANAIMQKRRARSNELQQKLTERLIAKTEQLGSTLYNLTWKTWVTPSGQSRSRLRASVLRTSETARTGWPTPSCNNDRTGNEQSALSMKREDGSKVQQRLQDFAVLAGWTTPTTRDWKDSGADIKPRSDTGKERFDQLPRQANLAGWPTPDTTMMQAKAKPPVLGNRKPTDPQISLADVAHHLAGWPTPVANDSTGSTHCYSGKNPDGSPGIAWKLSGAARLTGSGEILTGSTAGMIGGGQLNPDHSLWLMACPSALANSAPGSDDWLRWQGLMQQVLSERKATEPGYCPEPEMLSTSKPPASLSSAPSDLSDLL